MKQQTILAIDLGAESGRVMAVGFNGRSLHLHQLHRFPNPLTTLNGTLHWDFLHLWREICAGIEAGQDYKPVSLGVDTWGVDFGLLDKHGQLIGNPVNYRDPRTNGMMEAVLAKVPRADLFAQTGSQFMSINTLYQLMSLVVGQSPQLAIAHTFLMAPDLLNYWLTGAKVCEYSTATTTQLLNPQNGRWATPLMDTLGIPSHIFPDVVLPGTRLGSFNGIPVIAPACHDTGSAVAAVPAQGNHFAYISSGTWSLAGLELPQAIVNEAALAANATNEGGVYGSFRFLKNLMGLWILQQCRAAWGNSDSYAELVALAQAAPPLASIVPVNNGRFLPPGNHPQIIRDICTQTGQPVPQTKGAIVRCVLESLALAYRETLTQLTAAANHPVTTLHIVGGGSQNELLNQMAANATGLPVVAGPVEATVLGNALVQLITLGEIANHAEARQLVAEMDGMKRYEVVREETAVWDNAYHRYQHYQTIVQQS